MISWDIAFCSDLTLGEQQKIGSLSPPWTWMRSTSHHSAGQAPVFLLLKMRALYYTKGLFGNILHKAWEDKCFFIQSNYKINIWLPTIEIEMNMKMTWSRSRLCSRLAPKSWDRYLWFFSWNILKKTLCTKKYLASGWAFALTSPQHRCAFCHALDSYVL